MKNSGKLNDDVDELYKLPLAEFTGARNALSARLKQRGQANDANLVRSLAKPPVSAWAVNQLYWDHRKEFDSLLAAGKRFHKASLAGKTADLRAALDARREALSHLADLATSLLTEAGHNPSLDTIRRITTTLEAISAQSPNADGPTLGRLSQDVDPPGFELLASFMPGAGGVKLPATPARVSKSQKSGTTNAREKKDATREARQVEEMRRATIAAAKLTLQTAKKTLADARATAQSLEGVQKKVHAEAKEAEKRKREAEERFKTASAAYEEAARRARNAGAEVSEALNTVEDAKRNVEKATKELESLFRES